MHKNSYFRLSILQRILILIGQTINGQNSRLSLLQYFRWTDKVDIYLYVDAVQKLFIQSTVQIYLVLPRAGKGSQPLTGSCSHVDVAHTQASG
jgi:hypothetical protein